MQKMWVELHTAAVNGSKNFLTTFLILKLLQLSAVSLQLKQLLSTNDDVEKQKMKHNSQHYNHSE